MSEKLALSDGPRASPALVALEVPVPLSPRVVSLRSRQRNRRPCPWLESLAKGSLRSPLGAARRHVGPTSAAHIFRFQRAPASRTATGFRLGDELLLPGGTTIASRLAIPLRRAVPCFIGMRRFLPHPTGSAEPLTLRHHTGGRAEALSRPVRSRLVTSAASRDVTAASPNPERLPPTGTPRGLHQRFGLSPAPRGSRCCSLRLSPSLGGGPLRVGFWLRPRFPPPGTA